MSNPIIRYQKTSSVIFYFLALYFSMQVQHVWSSSIFSHNKSFMSAGTMYGPGKIPDSSLFQMSFANMAFISPMNLVIPFIPSLNNLPQRCGEHVNKAQGTLLSKNVTTCAFKLGPHEVFSGVPQEGPLQGQVYMTIVDGELIVLMDMVINVSAVEDKPIRIPMYGTTGKLRIPESLNTNNQELINAAGSLGSGDTLTGRLGDYNGDGMIDGAIVIVGNMPLNSIIEPGSPFAMLRYFDSDIPYEGIEVGRLPKYEGKSMNYDANMLTIISPIPVTE